jgi:hypothetical protein
MGVPFAGNTAAESKIAIDGLTLDGFADGVAAWLPPRAGIIGPCRRVKSKAGFAIAHECREMVMAGSMAAAIGVGIVQASMRESEVSLSVMGRSGGRQDGNRGH